MSALDIIVSVLSPTSSLQRSSQAEKCISVSFVVCRLCVAVCFFLSVFLSVSVCLCVLLSVSFSLCSSLFLSVSVCRCLFLFFPCFPLFFLSLLCRIPVVREGRPVETGNGCANALGRICLHLLQLLVKCHGADGRCYTRVNGQRHVAPAG